MVRTILRARWLAVALLALCLPLVASAQDRGDDCTLLSVGNDYLTVYTWEEPGNSVDRGGSCPVGAYGVVTGPEHPSGEGLDILQDGANPATSFNTVLGVGSNMAFVLSDGKTLQGTRGVEVTPLAAFGDADVVDERNLSITFSTTSIKGAEQLEIEVLLTVFGGLL
jgi:hypothetical protein